MECACTYRPVVVVGGFCKVPVARRFQVGGVGGRLGIGSASVDFGGG